MTQRRPFDPQEPFDAIAQLAKDHVTRGLIEARKQAGTLNIDQPLEFEALLAGAMVAVCGFAQAVTRPETHAEIRTALSGMLPGYFDQALEIQGLPPLGATQ